MKTLVVTWHVLTWIQLLHKTNMRIAIAYLCFFIRLISSKTFYFNSTRLSGIITHMYGDERDHIWFKRWPVAYSGPSHCLNQWLLVVTTTLSIKTQWNWKRKNYFLSPFIWHHPNQYIASVSVGFPSHSVDNGLFPLYVCLHTYLEQRV